MYGTEYDAEFAKVVAALDTITPNINDDSDDEVIHPLFTVWSMV